MEALEGSIHRFSLKVAITLAFIGSVISETVGGNNGIGFLMLSASARNDAPTTFAGLFAIAIMGVLMYAICALVEKRMTLLRDAWLASTGHKRPGLPPGQPLEKAQAEAAELTKQIAALTGGGNG